MLQITPIPLLTDNYAYFLEDAASGQTALIDPSEASGVLDFLSLHRKELHFILNTHHHPDHTGGNLQLKEKTGAHVVGFQGDQHRLPGLDLPLAEEDIFKLGNTVGTILFVPGHTSGHIAYYFSEDQALFTGDTLFSFGCGRLFEGSAEQMWHSLQKIAALPDETRLYCGHDYRLSNIAFARFLFPEDRDLLAEEARLQKNPQELTPMAPSSLEFEKRFNPFFCTQERPCEAGLSPQEIFALRRALKG